MEQRRAMTTMQITLPDQLAQAAEREGLLPPEMLEPILRERLRAKAFAKASQRPAKSTRIRLDLLAEEVHTAKGMGKAFVWVLGVLGTLGVTLLGIILDILLKHFPLL
jgi:hypothetical protein